MEYIVKTADERGHVQENIHLANSAEELRARFAQSGHYVYWVKPKGLAGKAGARKHVKLEPFLIFNQQFLTLIRAGLPILSSVELLAKRQKASILRAQLEDVAVRVRTGQSLSAAFESQGGFPVIYTTSLQAGERSGNLEEVLSRYLAFQRIALTFRKKLIASLFYPILLIVMVTGLFIFLISFVVPRFGALYDQIGTKLPAITVFMLDMGKYFQSYLPYLLVGFAAIVFGIFRWSRTDTGANQIDGLRIKTPIFGNIWVKYQVALFSRTLSTLLSGGLPLVPSLETAARSIGSRRLSNAVSKSVTSVREGKGLATSLNTTKIFPELSIEMIEVGEATGALPGMLNSVAEFFEEDVQTALTAALSLIEPAILIVMGGVVVTILIALYLPIFSLAPPAQCSTKEKRMADVAVVPNGKAVLKDETAQAQMLAARYRCEFVDLRNFRIQHELFRTVPVDMMFRYNFVPLEQLETKLVIAVSDPSKLMMLDEISSLLGQRIGVKVATLGQITDLLKKTEQSQRVLDEATEGLTFDVLSSEDNPDETLSIEKLTSEEDISPIIRLVDTMVFTALERRASDIHLETFDDCLLVKYRIDGVLQHAMAPIAREHHQTILSRIKVMSELDIAERRVPQDGRFRVRYKGRLIDFRVSIMPTVHGENAVLRVLDKESMSETFRSLTLDVVGFAEDDLRRFRRYIREPYGMVLVTGPTGSGKTTTLYAALNEIKSDEDKIITIEDPVEYQIRGITQIPVNEKKGLTFARGLRSILRHDPDKILVGEIRDQETAQIAINSALTGHLVFTTVHANNVVDVLGRFLNMGVEPYNFVSALNCILAQRLVRLICTDCKRPVEYDRETLQLSGLDTSEWSGFQFQEGAGCIECGGTGYRGRTAIHELLELNDRIREIILEKRPSSEVRKAARAEGMSFLRESALQRVRLGLTTLKEINKVTFIEASR